MSTESKDDRKVLKNLTPNQYYDLWNQALGAAVHACNHGDNAVAAANAIVDADIEIVRRIGKQPKQLPE